MTSRTINTVGILTGATLACSAMAQTTIYTCNFDVPPYAAGTIDAQQSWTTAQAGAIVAVPEMAIVTSGGPGAQAGNGFFSSTNGPNSSTSGRFAFQAADYPTTGTNGPLVQAIKTAEAGGASAIEFSAYITAPTPALSGTSNVNARHGMVLYAVDPTGANTFFKAAVGFQVRAFDRQVFVVQWLDAGQLGVPAPGGNYLINFTTPLLVEATGYTQIGCRWNRESGMPSIKVGAAEWTDVVATSTVGWTADEFDIVNTRGSATGGLNTVSTTAYMDSLTVAAAVPAYPQCTPAAGECDVAHAGGGCNIVSCCESVCNLNPLCCDVEWDQGCADTAISECGLFVYSCTNPGTPAGNCAIQPNVLSSLPVTLAYDTTSATTDGPPEPGCNSSAGDLPIHKDVWYRFQAATNGTLIASNCVGGGFGGSGNFDSKIAAYDLGTDLAAFDPQLLPDLYIGCNEDCAEDAVTFTSTLNVSGIVAGHYYLVRLGGYQQQSGSGDLYIGVQPPPNPCDPANLIQGVAGVNVVTVDTLYGDLDFTGTGCDFPLGDEKIYNAKFISFTPTGSGVLEVENCTDTGTEVDSRFAVLTQCGVVASVIGCDDDGCTAGTAPYTSKLQVNVTANTTYYIAVGGFDDGQAGPFNVNIIPPAAPACPADLNQDGAVNGADLGLLLGAWGACPGCAADLNADGVVNGADLGLLLGSWGPC
jgi:hypothetical protein